MPLKSTIIPFLDNIDDEAKSTHSVNTVKNVEGVLEGYNTDLYGILQVLRGSGFKNVTIYGSGSVVGTLIIALRVMGIQSINIIARSAVRAQDIKSRFNILDNLLPESIDLLINATPAGYTEDFENLMSRSSSVFDMSVSQKDTLIISEAKKEGKLVFSGVQMALHQFRQQFLIYTNIELSEIDIQRAMEQCFRI